MKKERGGCARLVGSSEREGEGADLCDASYEWVERGE